MLPTGRGERSRHEGAPPLGSALRGSLGAGPVVRRSNGLLASVVRESNGGGAGICTRVRKYIPAGIYDAYPPLSCRARREEAEQPPGTNPGKSRR